MNKLIILLLVVCFVSVHAFVKRDAPEAPKNSNAFEDLAKQIQDAASQFGSKVGETFSKDNIEKGFKDAKEFFDKNLNLETPKA